MQFYAIYLSKIDHLQSITKRTKRQGIFYNVNQTLLICIFEMIINMSTITNNKFGVRVFLQI